MTPKITIHTKLDSGIYASSGGGQDRVVATYNLGTRNLIIAIEKLHEVRAANRQGYGNIGCGMSWLAIDEDQIDDNDLRDVVRDDKKEFGRDYDLLRGKSRTAKAAALIASLPVNANA